MLRRLFPILAFVVGIGAGITLEEGLEPLWQQVKIEVAGAQPDLLSQLQSIEHEAERAARELEHNRDRLETLLQQAAADDEIEPQLRDLVSEELRVFDANHGREASEAELICRLVRRARKNLTALETLRKVR